MPNILTAHRRPLPTVPPLFAAAPRPRHELPDPWERINAALAAYTRLHGFDTQCWNAQKSELGITAYAYVGDDHKVVASAFHVDMFVSMRLLAWELEELCHGR